MKSYFWLFLMLSSIACTSRNVNAPAEEQHAPKVLAVYPTTDSLPENLLRLYVQFSQSMKAVNNLENIKLVGEKGEVIEGAIFNNVYELWDNEQKQLTLILDPARVKTGLQANQTFGRALEPNKHFQLIIEKAANIHGQPLEQPFVKDIYVVAEDKEMPNVNNWTVNPPIVGTTDELHLQFPQVLDRLSLLHRIRLVDSNHKIIKGQIKLANQEKEWRFIPLDEWEKGKYIIQVNSRLEDPAGNNLNGLFDHQIGSLKSKREGEIVELAFDIE